MSSVNEWMTWGLSLCFRTEMASGAVPRGTARGLCQLAGDLHVCCDVTLSRFRKHCSQEAPPETRVPSGPVSGFLHSTLVPSSDVHTHF